MKQSSIRKRSAQGEAALMAKVCYQDPELVELVSSFGFDAIWICLEHKRLDPSVVYSLIQACRLGGADPILRVKPSNYSDLLWLLESGAKGIMLPRVRHPDEVRDVLSAIKFPPMGRRGFDGIHADSGFGFRPATEYMADANRETLFIVQIEEPDVVPHIEEIAAIPGVDVLFVGPGDLSLGLDKFGQLEEPQVTAIINQVAVACRRHGKTAAIPCAPDEIRKYLSLGYGLLNVVSDYRCIAQGLRQTAALVAQAGASLRTLE
jgi:2-keto-3-deoxy-L-rhamnonate aldolase RhmA